MNNTLIENERCQVKKVRELKNQKKIITPEAINKYKEQAKNFIKRNQKSLEGLAKR